MRGAAPQLRTDLIVYRGVPLPGSRFLQKSCVGQDKTARYMRGWLLFLMDSCDDSDLIGVVVMRAYDLAVSAPWAMLPERVEELLAIAGREHDPEALEAYRSARHDRAERMTVRDGIAILDIAGPLFKRANLFVNYSGATSYEILRRDLQAALDDSLVTAIVLNVDSPGGEANGCDELAAAIFNARAKKPITAFVSGFACSGAYWIASAAQRIVVSDLATLGSIGVVLAVTDRRKADERAGISRVEFVSSQSPGKRPDVETDEGKRRVQKMVDDLGAVFVEAVAKHRKVSVETVISKFGKGGVEVGANAVKLGMADAVGQFEGVVRALGARQPGRTVRTAVASSSLRLQAAAVAAIASPVAKAAIAADPEIAALRLERKRYGAVNAIAPRGARNVHRFLRDQTDVSPEIAERILVATSADLGDIGWDPETSVDIRKMRAGTLGTAAWTIRENGEISYG